MLWFWLVFPALVKTAACFYCNEKLFRGSYVRAGPDPPRVGGRGGEGGGTNSAERPSYLTLEPRKPLGIAT